jgi:DnaJ like chaperone protein
LTATHLGAGKDDPYVILGVLPDASDEELRAEWKRQLSAAHPDRARARGLPEEFIAVAESKAASINAAFDTAMAERRQLGMMGAA